MIAIVTADLADELHATALIELMDVYASGIMGGGRGLSTFTKTHLARELHKRSYLFTLLAFDGATPVALANCVEGFSTFACKPLINIHDIVVAEEYRGQGIAFGLLTAVENEATKRGCCKITLEVLEGNMPAQNLYRKFGFSAYSLNPETGQALFWEKPLNQ